TVLIYLVDVTGLKGAQEAVRQNEERYRRLFEEAPVAYHEIDGNGVIRRVNAARLALLGLKPGQLLGKPAWELAAPEEREASKQAFHTKIGGEQPLASVEREYVRSDGTRLTLELHENLIRDADGRIMGLRSALLDVTERKQAERE